MSAAPSLVTGPSQVEQKVVDKVGNMNCRNATAVLLHVDCNVKQELFDIAVYMQQNCRGIPTVHISNFIHHLLLNLTAHMLSILTFQTRARSRGKTSVPVVRVDPAPLSSNHVIHQARDAMAFICNALCKVNPEKALKRFIPVLTSAIRTEIEEIHNLPQSDIVILRGQGS
jgi:hypothetical protein